MGTAEIQNPPGRSRTETALSFSWSCLVQTQLLSLSKGSCLLSSFHGCDVLLVKQGSPGSVCGELGLPIGGASLKQQWLIQTGILVLTAAFESGAWCPPLTRCCFWCVGSRAERWHLRRPPGMRPETEAFL